MIVSCIWEHNGSDTLLYAVELPGAYTRGKSLEDARSKMEAEAKSYLCWAGCTPPEIIEVQIAADVPSDLQIADADSDVLFPTEQQPLTSAEYAQLKTLVLQSAADFHRLYQSIPDKHRVHGTARETFYGKVPQTAEEMYIHTKSVNAYYFAEINVDADNDGTIWECRKKGFAALEQQPDFLKNPVIEGSYGEYWSLRKLLRRFLWHDRIHARAMYRMAVQAFGEENIPNVFAFSR